MRYAVIDMDAQPEAISAAWSERDRAADVADDLNREHNTTRYVVMPIEQRELDERNDAQVSVSGSMWSYGDYIKEAYSQPSYPDGDLDA